MKGMSSLILNSKTNESSSDKKSSDEKEFVEYREIGDVDELIFPDDEPHYISER